jgi:hypothetical protein
MRSLIWAGWLMVAMAALLAGSIAAGSAPFGVLMVACLAGPGLLMVWLAQGWDRSLEGTADLHRFGRPANATVHKVEDSRLDADGKRTAKLSLHVAPRNESSYDARRRVARPGGRIPSPGERVTIKFDPDRRREFVLLEENYDVESFPPIST